MCFLLLSVGCLPIAPARPSAQGQAVPGLEGGRGTEKAGPWSPGPAQRTHGGTLWVHGCSGWGHPAADKGCPLLEVMRGDQAAPAPPRPPPPQQLTWPWAQQESWVWRPLWMVTMCGDTSSLRARPTLHPAPGLCRPVVGKALSNSAGGQGGGGGSCGAGRRSSSQEHLGLGQVSPGRALRLLEPRVLI